MTEENIKKENSLEARDYAELDKIFALVDNTVYKRYLNDLSEYAVLLPDKMDLLQKEDAECCLRALRLKRLSIQKGEDMLQKLSTVYHASMESGCGLFVLIDVDSESAPAQIYVGVRNSNYGQIQNLASSFKTLQKGLESHFPGTVNDPVSIKEELEPRLESIFSKGADFIASVSTAASARDKNGTENKNFIQGIEKLIDGMRGHSYTALFIAEPVSASERGVMRKGYENLYSTLAPYAKCTWSYNKNESMAVMESLSEGTSKSVTHGISNTQSHTVAKTISFNMEGSISGQKESGVVVSKTKPTKVARAGQGISAVKPLLTVAGSVLAATPLAPVGYALEAAGFAAGVAGNLMQGTTITEGITNSVGHALGLGGGLTYGNTEGNTKAEGTNYNRTDQINENRTTGATNTRETGQTIQITYTIKTIEELLTSIENQLERLREIEDYGAYHCGAYFMSGAGKRESSILAANIYQALMMGEGSGVETSAINYWSDPDVVSALQEYLRRMEHPLFVLPYLDDEAKQVMDYVPYSAATMVSGRELPIHMGLPMKSVDGLPVVQYAEFGRNAVKSDDNIPIGVLFDMGLDTETKVGLDLQSMAAHTFITGSTNAGKSNTVYKILEGILHKEGRHFLVIEPAKGEYAEMFGTREDTTVYGTNPMKSPRLLRLNPFSFPEEIHILEHLDRLVEIFGACWPMYAAMPAILKEAMEKAYESKGWDLCRSKSASGDFPTFKEVVKNLREVIGSSEYSSDTKSDYTGALVTRVRSLTTGLYGQIFCSDEEISGEKLFDENVIIDLSRVGASETKALLMGVLVLKLQEHRLARANGANEPLKHITVLEEAHNLLRRCCYDNAQDSADLRGMSVEMISNAIAEMRTYGEGFIIVDQAPGLLDMSVIRNTNTKIIMRLPDEGDRWLVGRAANLNDDQIMELARLEKGVAAVYQNDWMEAILCHVEEFRKECFCEASSGQSAWGAEEFFRILLGSGGESFDTLSRAKKKSVRQWIEETDMDGAIRKLIYGAMGEKRLTETYKKNIVYDFFDAKGIYMDVIKKGGKEAMEKFRKDIEIRYGIKDRKVWERIKTYLMQGLLDMETDQEKRALIQKL